jgi:hypothetical protein
MRIIMPSPHNKVTTSQTIHLTLVSFVDGMQRVCLGFICINQPLIVSFVKLHAHGQMPLSCA